MGVHDKMKIINAILEGPLLSHFISLLLEVFLIDIGYMYVLLFIMYFHDPVIKNYLHFI